jgi:hypothetical protein
MIGIAAPPIFHASKKLSPGLVIRLRVQLIRLMDVQPAFELGLLDERRFGGSES